MKLTILIRSERNKDTPPDGFDLFLAPIWPIPELGLSADKFGFSSFQVIPAYIPETKSWSAISNFSIWDFDAVVRIQKLQPDDGYALNVKMKWLVHSGTGVGPMWTGNTGLDWNETTTYRSGSMLWGRQVFAASKETYAFYTKAFGFTDYRKCYEFRRSDWQRDKHIEWLYPRAAITRSGGGFSNDFGRGEIRTPLMIVSQDYQFAGHVVPSGFFVPASWCNAL